MHTTWTGRYYIRVWATNDGRYAGDVTTHELIGIAALPATYASHADAMQAGQAIIDKWHR